MPNFFEFFRRIIVTLLALAAFVRYPMSTRQSKRKRRAAKSGVWAGTIEPPIGISGPAQGRAGRCNGAAITER
jgi:hypothetical protein